MDRLAGDVELYHRVLEMLVPSLTKALQQFDAARADSDRTGLQSVVHGVRGMAANIGAVALAAAASELEDMLKARGGRYSKAPDWQPYAVTEGNLITGQNPESSEAVANALLEQLRRQRKPA